MGYRRRGLRDTGKRGSAPWAGEEFLRAGHFLRERAQETGRHKYRRRGRLIRFLRDHP
jgi:hypothetical protein